MRLLQTHKPIQNTRELKVSLELYLKNVFLLSYLPYLCQTMCCYRLGFNINNRWGLPFPCLPCCCLNLSYCHLSLLLKIHIQSQSIKWMQVHTRPTIITTRPGCRASRKCCRFFPSDGWNVRNRRLAMTEPVRSFRASTCIPPSSRWLVNS